MRNQTECLYRVPGVLSHFEGRFSVNPANAGIQSEKALTGFVTSGDLDLLDSRVRGNDGVGNAVCCAFPNPFFIVKQPLFSTSSMPSPRERDH
jgi:hypothetical protein